MVTGPTWSTRTSPTQDNYIESEWWSLKKIYEKGLLYKGHKIVPYCPRCGTALSSHEVAQGYKRVEETSAVVRFKVKGTENTYLTAWTTTPWTLPSNVALCVNPDEDYVKLTFEGDTYYMAGALVESIFGGKEEKPVIVETMKAARWNTWSMSRSTKWSARAQSSTTSSATAMSP